MKTLILSAQDTEGGAGRAAYRLHQGLRANAVDSHMLVNLKFSDDTSVHAPSSAAGRWFSRTKPVLNRLPLMLYRNRQNVMFSCQWFPDSTIARMRSLEPDIVNVHWICDGLATIRTLANIKQPMVWTLHDMWAFTGGCHYTQGCERYQQSCGACPQLASSQDCDISKWIWQRKASMWRKISPTVVTPSRWLADCARNSPLFQNIPIVTIPNGLDLKIYRPIESQLARKLLNLPLNKTIVLFGAIKPTQDTRKGFHILQPALQILKQSMDSSSLELAILGASQVAKGVELGFRAHCLGIVKDDLTLALIYSAVDAFIAPSLQDNLPNTVVEALACGTPCVAFNIGGMPDLIDHQSNGFLAKPYCVESLAAGIAWVLQNNQAAHLRENARAKAASTFSLEGQVSRYQDLFKQILDTSLISLR